MDPRKPRRRTHPAIEPLGPRALPSIAPYLYAAHAAAGAPRLSAAEIAARPTPHEQVRQSFRASFVGRVVIGPGRFTDQQSRLFFSGPMTSSAFLRGNLAAAIVIPKDPASSPVGQAAMIVQNVSNTGNLLVLDLTATGRTDARGLPTQFTWTVDGASGGTFSNAVGSGTLTVSYRGLGGPAPKPTREGAATLVFRGGVYTTGLTEVLRF